MLPGPGSQHRRVRASPPLYDRRAAGIQDLPADTSGLFGDLLSLCGISCYFFASSFEAQFWASWQIALEPTATPAPVFLRKLDLGEKAIRIDDTSNQLYISLESTFPYDFKNFYLYEYIYKIIDENIDFGPFWAARRQGDPRRIGGTTAGRGM